MSLANNFTNNLDKASNFVTKKIRQNKISKKAARKASVAIILGSGYSSFTDKLEILVKIPYQKIPGMKMTQVDGHKGELILARYNETIFFVLSGRLHYYEGYSMQAATFSVFLLNRLGVKNLIITNAAGSVNRSYHPGDLVLIQDHINGMGADPLRREVLLKNPFVDLTHVYDKEFIRIFFQLCDDHRVSCQSGIYYANSGPAFETPAEIKMIEQMGGDMVGMSTLPEAVAARYLKMKIFAFSIISNYGSGINGKNGINHDDVIETVKKTVVKASNVIIEMILQMSIQPDTNKGRDYE